jgi:hypothetical protein
LSASAGPGRAARSSPGRAERRVGGNRTRICDERHPAQAFAEVGVEISRHTPRPVNDELVSAADNVVVLGSEPSWLSRQTSTWTWELDEPSTRGINGIAQMRLVRDGIEVRVRDPVTRTGLPPT